jgi:hypothetical protein
MLGIYEPCPNNVRFLIKPLKKVGFKKKFYVKVRLNLKIRNMLGHPKILQGLQKEFITRFIHPRRHSNDRNGHLFLLLLDVTTIPKTTIIITIPAIRDKMGAAPVWNVVTFSGAGVIALIEVSSSTGFIRGSDDVV